MFLPQFSIQPGINFWNSAKRQCVKKKKRSQSDVCIFSRDWWVGCECISTCLFVIRETVKATWIYMSCFLVPEPCTDVSIFFFFSEIYGNFFLENNNWRILLVIALLFFPEERENCAGGNRQKRMRWQPKRFFSISFSFISFFVIGWASSKFFFLFFVRFMRKIELFMFVQLEKLRRG